MVNKTKFYKTKVALAVVLSLGLAACGDSDGDEGSTTTSNSVVEDASGNTLEQAQGTGSVQGTVLDTNGLPVMGATVRLAGQTQTTDASGYYHFTDVPVSGVDGSNEVNAAAPYTVTITSPEGYANATVKVTTNNIQIDSGNNGDNANASQTEASGEQTTWFDGFLAQADTASLPKFAASVTGVLRDCNTGAVLPAGVKVALDFSEISDTDTGAPKANNVTIGVPVFSTTTGAGGVFTFDSLPTDSTLTLLVEGYRTALLGNDATETDGALEDVQTAGEGIVNNLGTANLCLITSNDLIDLKVTSVSAVVDDVDDGGRDWGVLNQGVNGEDGIVISFNEPMVASELDIDTDGHLTGSVLVKTTAGVSSYITDFTAKLNATNDAITVTLGAGEGLVEGDKLSIYLPSHNMQDTAGNFLDDDAADDDNDGMEDSDDNLSDIGVYVSLDNDFDAAKATYLRVDLCAYLAPTTETEALAATWIVDASTAQDASQPLLATYNSAETVVDSKYGSFADGDDLNINGADNIVQLNGDADTAIRLAKLGSEISDTAISVEHDAARFTLDPKDSSKVDIVVYRTIAGEERKVVSFDTSSDLGVVTTGSVYNKYATNNVNGFNITAWEDADTGVIDFTLDNLETGDKIVFVPYDGFGIKGEADKQANVTVTDVIAPTAVIQESYGLGSLGLVYTAEATDGDGGEHVNATDASAGNPLLWVTPRLFAGSETAWDASTLNVVDDGVFSGLTIAGTTNTNVYGQPQYAAKDAVPANVGVAFSEDLTKVETGALVWAATNGSSITAHVAANNIDNIDGLHSVDTAGDNDVVSVAFDNIMELANTDNDEALSFAGAYSDALGNETLADAKVVFKDALPPFVTSATLEADAFTITFNEDIDATATDILAMRAQDAAVAYNSASAQLNTLITGITADDVTITGNVAVIDLSDGANFTLLAALFTDGTSTSPYNFADEEDGTVYGHAILDFSNVTDENGFSWDYYTGDASAVVPNVGTFNANTTPVAANGRLRIDSAPSFYMTDAIGPFAILDTSTAIGSVTTSLDGAVVAGANGSTITFTINMSHPLDFDTSFSGSLPAAHPVTGIYDVSTVLNVGVDSVVAANGVGALDLTDGGGYNNVANADLLLVGTGVPMQSDGVTQDHLFTLSADKRTLTLMFKTAVETDVANICSTIMDADNATQPGGGATASAVTSDYTKDIIDASFRFTSDSCATPHVDVLPDVDTSDYDRP